MPQEPIDDMSTFNKASTWANINPDLCRHMAPLGYDELTHLSHSMLKMFLGLQNKRAAYSMSTVSIDTTFTFSVI